MPHSMRYESELHEVYAALDAICERTSLNLNDTKSEIIAYQTLSNKISLRLHKPALEPLNLHHE
jgi:molecular chaperone DnaK (HSP70)